MTFATYDVCALGNAIVDIVADVPEDFLRQHGVSKNKVTLVDQTKITLLRKSLKGARSVHAGGAAGNTVTGVAAFGGKAAYMGRVAYDDIGQLFNDDLVKQGIYFNSPLSRQDGAVTGLCVALVTPDATRSMFTCLGAATDFKPDDIDRAIIGDAKITFLEGYMFDAPSTKASLAAAADIAHAAGRKVALGLCDPSCVERNRAALVEFVNHKVDIVIANEKELMKLYQTFHLENAITDLKQHAETAVITRSEHGSLVVNAARHFAVESERVPHVVDKTGAGDAFAAGFLFGLARDFDLSWCAKFGSIAAAEVISHYGARPLHSLAALAKQKGALL